MLSPTTGHMLYPQSVRHNRINPESTFAKGIEISLASTIYAAQLALSGLRKDGNIPTESTQRVWE